MPAVVSFAVSLDLEMRQASCIAHSCTHTLTHTHTHTTHHSHTHHSTDGEFLRLMQVGTDLFKIKKKTYPRIYRLDNDLLGITWNSRSKRSTKARSKCLGCKGREGGGGWGGRRGKGRGEGGEYLSHICRLYTLLVHERKERRQGWCSYDITESLTAKTCLTLPGVQNLEQNFYSNTESSIPGVLHARLLQICLHTPNPQRPVWSHLTVQPGVLHV